jgi:D-proline reductase (dithiol) PrdB
MEFVYEEGPFTPLEKNLQDVSVALISSGGHFLADSDPAPFGVEGMSQDEAVNRIQDFLKAKPELIEIPSDTAPGQLRVRHGGYDIRAAEMDPDAVFPLRRLREIAEQGHISALHPMAYSFVGVCSQLRLLNEAGPAWVQMLQAQDVDAVLLVPV